MKTPENLAVSFVYSLSRNFLRRSPWSPHSYVFPPLLSPHFLLIIAAVARRARASPQIKTAGGSVVIAVEDGQSVGYKVIVVVFLFWGEEIISRIFERVDGCCRMENAGA